MYIYMYLVCPIFNNLIFIVLNYSLGNRELIEVPLTRNHFLGFFTGFGWLNMGFFCYTYRTKINWIWLTFPVYRVSFNIFLLFSLMKLFSRNYYFNEVLRELQVTLLLAEFFLFSMNMYNIEVNQEKQYLYG